MKKGKKTIAIWLIGIIVAIVISVVVSTAVTRFIFSADTDFSKYANKAEKILYPEDMEEQDKVSAVLNLRSMLSDHRFVGFNGIIGVASFTGATIDFSVKFDSRDGDSPLKEGKWIPVLKQDGEGNLLKDTIGVVSANQLLEADYAEELYKLLAEHNNAIIILNKYAKENYVIIPLSLTIQDALGNELASFNVTDTSYPSDEIVTAEANIYNIYHPDELFDNADYCLYNIMTMLKDGKRKTDTVAESMVASADYNNKQSYNKTTYGIGSFMIKQFAISDDGNYLMAYVVEYNYFKSFALYSCILIAMWSLIVWIVSMTNKKEKTD